MIVVNPTDAVAIIGCLIGAVGLVYAHLAYLAAKKSNRVQPASSGKCAQLPLDHRATADGSIIFSRTSSATVR